MLICRPRSAHAELLDPTALLHGADSTKRGYSKRTHKLGRCAPAAPRPPRCMPCRGAAPPANAPAPPGNMSGPLGSSSAPPPRPPRRGPGAWPRGSAPAQPGTPRRACSRDSSARAVRKPPGASQGAPCTATVAQTPCHHTYDEELHCAVTRTARMQSRASRVGQRLREGVDCNSRNNRNNRNGAALAAHRRARRLPRARLLRRRVCGAARALTCRRLLVQRVADVDVGGERRPGAPRRLPIPTGCLRVRAAPALLGTCQSRGRPVTSSHQQLYIICARSRMCRDVQVHARLRRLSPGCQKLL